MKRKLRIKNLFLVIGIILLLCFCGFMVFMILKPTDKKETSKKTETKKTETKKEKTGEIPVIKLYGIEDMRIVKNGVYEEYGGQAIDTEDKDLTEKIKITNNIDITKAGKYEVIYEVTDSDNNKAKATRNVEVFEVTEKADSIPVFMYHYFYDDEAGEVGEDSNFLAKSLFEGQLKYLSENNYYIPTMKELDLFIDGKLDLPKNSAILTLDDGKESNYRIAYPLAVQYKIPLVWFVVTSWTDVSNEYQKELYNSGYTRYHSHTDEMHEGGCGEQHGARILCIDHAAGVNDLKTSAEKLGNYDALAYPTGDTNEHAIEIVKESGIKLAFTVNYGYVHVGDNKYKLDRLRINDGISLDSYISMLN